MVSRKNFPELSEAVKPIYERVFGKDRYELYRNSVNGSPKSKAIEKLTIRHSGHHDVESFAWVLFHELLMAWPVNSKEHCLSSQSMGALMGLRDHCFGYNYDGRPHLFKAKQGIWEELLHPDLQCLAPTLEKISTYLSTDWERWPEILEDHAHEALAICLIEMAVILMEKGDPIELQEKERSPEMGSYVSSFMIKNYDVTSPKSKKRTGDDSQTGPPKRSKTSRVKESDVQAGPSENYIGPDEDTNQSDL